MASLIINQSEIQDPLTAPKLSATIINNSLYDLENLDVIAIVYNSSGNAISASSSLFTISNLASFNNPAICSESEKLWVQPKVSM